MSQESSPSPERAHERRSARSSSERSSSERSSSERASGRSREHVSERSSDGSSTRSGDREIRYRVRRVRRRKKHKPPINVRGVQLWQILAAVGVSLLGALITIILVGGIHLGGR